MKSEFIVIDGEKYISSGRASKLFGYTSDHIGFLAREGKVKSRIIGRARFVNQNSLAQYRAPSKHISFIPPSQPVRPAVLPEPRVKTALPDFNISRSVVLAIILLSLFLPPVVSQLADYVFEFDPGSVIGRRAEPAAPGFNRSKLLVATVGSSWSDFAEKIKNESVKLDKKLFAFLDSANERIENFFVRVGTGLSRLAETVRTILARRTETTKVAVIDDEKEAVDDEKEAEPPLEVQPPEGEPAEIVEVYPVPASEAPSPSGLAVFPASGDQELDQELTQSIEESFSDEVLVRFDESRRTGVITPVFRERVGDNYIFVLVPVKNVGDGI